MPQPPSRGLAYHRGRQGGLTVVSSRLARPPSWEEATSAYLRDCRRRNLARTTLFEYEYVLCENMRVTLWRREHGIATVADLNRATLTVFEAELTDAGLKPATVASVHRRLQTFGRWCQREYGYGGSVADVRPPMLPQREPATFSDNEIHEVLEAAECERDRLIVELFLATGVRLEEMSRITIDDLQETQAGVLLHVRGKGRKDRVVPVDTPQKPLSRRLQRYISHVRPHSIDRALFLTQSRENGEHVGLTRRGIAEILRRLARTTGLRVHAHRFRHTFATRSISAGVNPLILQRVLGHTTQRMVSLYVHMKGDDILEAWAKRAD